MSVLVLQLGILMIMLSNSFAIFTVETLFHRLVSIDAVITASIATNSDITFTFSEPVRNLDDTEITNLNWKLNCS